MAAAAEFLRVDVGVGVRDVVIGIGSVGFLSECTRFRCEKQLPELATTKCNNNENGFRKCITFSTEKRILADDITYMLSSKTGICTVFRQYADSCGISDLGYA